MYTLTSPSLGLLPLCITSRIKQSHNVMHNPMVDNGQVRCYLLVLYYIKPQLKGLECLYLGVVCDGLVGETGYALFGGIANMVHWQN